jgi:hypothetical protein
VPQTPQAIAAKAKEIYALASESTTPLAALNLQGTLLLGDENWSPHEVECVSGEVLDMLIKRGWQKRGS